MRTIFTKLLLAVLLLVAVQTVSAQERRPIDSKHPMWLIHVAVWNQADPQKIIDLIPDDIKPYVCMNLSLSCSYKTDKNVYEKPQNAVRTFRSWASVCQHNGMWFTCQPASGGHTHIQDDDLETFEYFFKTYPNFLGWNYAEQFWGFDAAGDKSSSSQESRIALFAKLVPMHHKYGGVLTISFCGNIWSHLLNPVGMMKRNKDLLKACQDYPEAILWLYKYTTSSCFYNNESVTWSPFISGLAKNYGVRYDNCGWNGATNDLVGEGLCKYPVSAGIGTVMEQTCVNGGAVWDGPELIWTEDFQNKPETTVNGYTRRNWAKYPGFDNAWIDMFRKIIDGTMYIPTREEVVAKTKIAVINDISSGTDEEKYAAWGDLYDGVYKQTDPFNRSDGRWMNNYCYFKKTGRYGAIPVCLSLYDETAKTIPLQIKKSAVKNGTKWSSQTLKTRDFNKYYPEVSTGDLYVNRYKNQLVTYTPYSYLNKKTTATASIPLQYNTCETLELTYGKLSSGIIHEHADHIDFYLNNYRTDSMTKVLDKIVVKGATAEPTFTTKKRGAATLSTTSEWDAETGTFTLNVSHMGPIDLTINCEGAATERSTDEVSQTPLTEDLPKQPEEFHGAITIEAEDMDYKSIKACCGTSNGNIPLNMYPNMRGHAGMGFVEMGTNTSGALKHIINIKEAGTYNVTIRYTSPNKGGSLAVSINGRKTLKYDKTAQNEWKTITCSTEMKAGNNTLIITNTGGVSLFIDNVTYTPADVAAPKYGVFIRETAEGTITSNVSEAEEGEEVTLTITPNEGYGIKALKVINSVFYTQDLTIPVDLGATEVTFNMVDDNMTILPIFSTYDPTAIYMLDFSEVLNGDFPKGWRTTDGTNVREYPTTNSTGPRTMTGFTGYQGKALYWRNTSAEYGRQTQYPLTLEPGTYELTFASAAWKGTPAYQVNILNSENAIIASSDAYTASPNVNGSTSGNISSAKHNTLAFKVTTAGNYVIQFASTSGGYTEFLLAECKLKKQSDVTDIQSVGETATALEGIYNAAGVRIPALQKGLNFVRTKDGQTKKIMVK